MAARTIWVLLWPAAIFAGIFDLLVWGLTCGDDGAADYGSESAGRYCDTVGEWDVELLVTAAPLLVLATGVAWWDRPRSLRRANVLAAGLVVAIAAVLAAWATAYSLALMIVLLSIVPLGFVAALAGPSVPSDAESDTTSGDRLARASLALMLTAIFVGFVYARVEL